jgi:hypothetical protein
MATIKSYTDISQSKKLAEILPLGSADMHFINDNHAGCVSYFEMIKDSNPWLKGTNISPCWSLASLLDVLESEIDGEEGETYQLNLEKDGTWWNIWYREQYDEANPIEVESTEELVDACVEMIIKLHEQKML